MRQERGRIRYTFFQRGLPVTGRHEWAQAKVPSLHYSITPLPCVTRFWLDPGKHWLGHSMVVGLAAGAGVWRRRE